MTKLESILFEQGDFNEKKSYIDNMLVDELVSVNKSLVKKIIEKCGNEYKELLIDGNRRQGNDWNSLIESVYISNDKVFVGIYVQNTKTDTTDNDYFDNFFRRGQYYFKDNYLKEGVYYNESQKAEVMRSILLECIYDQFNDKVQRDKLVAKYRDCTIVGPVLNHFFKEWDLWHKDISRYSSRDTIVKKKGYYYGRDKIEEYVEKNVDELVGKSEEELQAIYKKVFLDAYNEFDKNFDFNKWRSECTLWY